MYKGYHGALLAQPRFCKVFGCADVWVVSSARREAHDVRKGTGRLMQHHK